jgi:hypothetical protein
MGKKKQVRCVQSISVPPDLRARMDKVKEPVNWSAIACQAFEAKLNEIAKVKELKDMSDVIERLRASKQETASDEYNHGVEAGEEWAKSTAEYAELRRLGELEERTSTVDWEQFFCTGDSDAYGAANRLVFAIQPDTEGSRMAAEEFWEFTVGEDTELTDDFVRGFADGALKVWHEVKDQV